MESSLPILPVTRMSQLSVIATLQYELVSPKGTQEGEEYLWSSSHQTAATPYGELQGSLWWKKQRILAPDNWDACERNDFSEPRLLHLLIHTKALNSLTWDVWFSLINNKFLMFRPPALCCKLLFNLATHASTPSLEQFSQGYFRCCLLGLKS